MRSLPDKGQALTHLAHPEREVRHRSGKSLILQVSLDLVAVLYRSDITQRSAENGIRSYSSRPAAAAAKT